ncbi:MAG: hypothetical protein IJ087_10080 [Eggerthellaceae bacterium]|nr:hypothetical protein [Eggerthellaceae bacterium]
MAIDSSKIIIGAPDQSSTTGAVAFADTTATLPTTAVATLGTGWEDGGYVSEDGVSVTPTYSTVDIKDWSRASVRSLLDEFTGELKFAFIQTDYESLVALFGSDNVTKVAATTTHGEQIKVSMGARMAPAKAWCFSMKDGDARVRIVLPNAQPTIDGDLVFVANEPITWSVSLKCNADSNGDNIIILTDDGQTTSSN